MASKEPSFYITLTESGKVYNVAIVSEANVVAYVKSNRVRILTMLSRQTDSVQYLEECIATFMHEGEDVLKVLHLDNPLAKATTSQVTKRAAEENFRFALWDAFSAVVHHYPPLHPAMILGERNAALDAALKKAAAKRQASAIKKKGAATIEVEQELSALFSTELFPEVHDITNIDQIDTAASYLASRIIGQEPARRTLINSSKAIATGQKERGVYMFLGPTGVGKTQLAKEYAKAFHKDRVFFIDCASIAGGHELARLAGPPPGYVGYQDEDGNKVDSGYKQKSDESGSWTIIIDELEKANPKALPQLMHLIEQGWVEDNHGHKCDFTKSSIILTSNLGTNELKWDSCSFSDHSMSEDEVKSTLEKAVSRLLPDEFTNRIASVIHFSHLEPDEVRQVVMLQMDNYSLDYDEDVIDWIVKGCYDRKFGARRVKPFIEEKILPETGDAALRGIPTNSNGDYTLSIEEGKLVIVEAELAKNSSVTA